MQIDSSELDTTPIYIQVPGVLSLDVRIHPQSDGEVHVAGELGFALSQSVESAISFLPPLVRWGLSSGLVHRELEGQRYRFKVANLVSIDTILDEEALLTLSARYQTPLARPVGQKETSQVFRRFADGLERSGLSPRSHDIVEQFLHGFNRADKGELPFLALFEGRTITQGDRTTPPIVGLRLTEVELKQNSKGDLVVVFATRGWIQGYENSLAG